MSLAKNTLEHMAIIMDGNSRWAKKKKLTKIIGYKAGKNTLTNIIKYCVSIKLKTLTVFAFSSENTNRPKNDVRDLFNLFLKSLKTETVNLKKDGIKLKIIGDLSVFNKKTIATANSSQQILKDGKAMTLVIAINYSGKWDIVEACKKIATNAKHGNININDIDKNTLASNISLKKEPNVDLLIRTGGEMRISNFLLWDIAYSELFFTNTLWPDFTKEELSGIISEYKNRDRRFGI